MNFTKINKLNSQIEIIEQQLDKMEEPFEAGETKNHPENTEIYMTLYRRKVALSMQVYQLTWPDAKLKMNNDKTEFYLI